jgi:hypothetical protein
LIKNNSVIIKKQQRSYRKQVAIRKLLTLPVDIGIGSSIGVIYFNNGSRLKTTPFSHPLPPVFLQ